MPLNKPLYFQIYEHHLQYPIVYSEGHSYFTPGTEFQGETKILLLWVDAKEKKPMRYSQEVKNPQTLVAKFRKLRNTENKSTHNITSLIRA